MVQEVRRYFHHAYVSYNVPILNLILRAEVLSLRKLQPHCLYTRGGGSKLNNWLKIYSRLGETEIYHSQK